MNSLDLKAKLISKARARKSDLPQQRVQPAGDTVEVDARFCRFDQMPAYQQMQLMHRSAEALGIGSPFFRVHEGCAGATTRINGRELINFASYNYLDLSGDPRVIQAAAEAAQQYGTSVSASRPVAGERPIHRQLEQAIAEFYEVDDAVAFVSGHATNVSTIGHLFGPRDLILHDELIHNSALVGAQLSGARRRAFAHNNLQALERLLIELRGQFERVLIVVEGLYSMDGDYPDLARLVALKRKYAAFLMVDEAHSLGVMGSEGKGIRELFSVAGCDVDIWMGTLSKALAGCGGYIAGERALVEQLKFLAPGFLYSVGMPAQVAAPSLKALALMQAEPERRQRLAQRSQYFLQQANKRGFDTGDSCGLAVVPVLTGSSVRAARLSQQLLEDGVNVQPILHPAVPESAARLRFFITCAHTEAQIDATLNALARRWDG